MVATLTTIGPRKVIKTGPGHGPAADPMPILAEELSQYREAVLPGVTMPPMAGGAIGYVSYDAIQYFEPRTARPLKDVLGVPESLFMLFDTIVAFDHFYQTVRVISYLHVPGGTQDLEEAYNRTISIIHSTARILLSPEVPVLPQPPITPNQDFTSNVGQAGYEEFVRRLKEHIHRGDIIQCVPSHRLSRPTSLHPFNIYRHLRTVNPSPYLFYLSCADFSIVGASPELLVRSSFLDNKIITHPIAGTVKRNLLDPVEDERLADSLRESIKDRAEHVMLVDLARNDVNRVCDPRTTRVDRLMEVQKFSHVQHLVSQVSGVLRPGKTRFDAFRSIFPAGTVSGAPKVSAMCLIGELEQEKRGIYAGAVGYWGYDRVALDGEDGRARVREGAMDTCIALRTMLVKGGVAYLQAGGGIVFDSDPYEEWLETMNKLGANRQCITGAEERYADEAAAG
jgi:anthranilate synthase component I